MKRLKIYPEGLLAAAAVIVGLLTLAWSRDFPIILNAGDAAVFVLPALLTIGAATTVLAGWRSGDPKALHTSLENAGRMGLHIAILGLASLTAVMAISRGDFFGHAFEQAGGAIYWRGLHDPLSFLSMLLFFLAGVTGIPPANDQSALAQWTRRGLSFLFCAVLATIWLGAWYDPFGQIAALEKTARDGDWITDERLAALAGSLGICLLFVKTLLLMLFQRVAQKTSASRCCQSLTRLDVFLPVAIANVLAMAAYLWLVEPLRDFQRAMSIVMLVAAPLVMVGLFAAAMPRRQAKSE